MKGIVRQRDVHMERMLFVVGNPNAGKSRLLRSMFIDPRLGSGLIPTSSIIPPVTLSKERCLVVRATSPHEMKETLNQFSTKIERAMRRARNSHRRFNYACALQPAPANNMPDVVIICKHIKQIFRPERIRIVQINPEQSGIDGTLLSKTNINKLRHLSVEVVTVDAHRSSTLHPNGMFLADFFDFT